MTVSGRYALEMASRATGKSIEELMDKPLKDYELEVDATKYIIRARKLGNVAMGNGFGNIWYYTLYELENGKYRVHQTGYSDNLTKEMDKKKLSRKYPSLVRKSGISEVVDLR